MQIQNNIVIDLQQRKAPPQVDAMQNDALTRAVKVVLYDGGTVWEPPAGATVSLAYCKADKTSGWYDKLPDESDACSIFGNEVRAVVVFQDENLNRLATFPFYIMVEADPAADTTKSNNYYKLQNLEQINNAVEDLQEQMGILINDTVVGADAWSGKNIVDRLCPGFTERGSVVTCQPVEGYPLKVVTRIDPVQSGTGDPSPENVRPITGHTAVNLRHTGKNLLDINDTLTFTQWIRLNFHLPAGTYTVSHNGYAQGAGATKAPCLIFPGFDQNAEQRYLLSEGKSKTITIEGPTTGVGIYTNGYAFAGSEGVECTIYDLQITPVGANIGYEPYRGQELTADFGQTVYGGSYDWGNGILTVDTGEKTVTDSDHWLEISGSNYYQFNVGYGAYDFAKIRCDKLPAITYEERGVKNGVIAAAGNTLRVCFTADSDINSMDAFRAWLAEIGGLTVVVKLTQPYTVQLTPQELFALSGENVLYSDTGDTAVTGKADPTTIIEKLTNAILALGGNV